MRPGLIVALAVVCGCAAGLEANRRSSGVVAGGTFTPGRSSAVTYGEDPGRACENSGSFQVLADELAGGPKQIAKADGCLCAAAEALLGWEENAERRQRSRSRVASRIHTSMRRLRCRP